MSHPYTVVVPVSGSQASLDAVPVACAIARARKGTVIAVHVIEVARRLPLDANLDAEARRGEGVLRRAEEIARRADCPITGELLQAREPGTAIVEESIDRNADLIVLGLPHRRRGDGDLGATVSHILRVAPAQVMIVRQAAGAEAQALSQSEAQVG